MIELLLQAERALSVGMVDQAERLYRQAVEADPRNSIAVVGLARVALERADDREAYRQSKRALSIDPENAAAARLVTRLEEVFAHRGETVPTVTEEAAAVAVRAPEPATPAEPAPVTPAASASATPAAPEPAPRATPAEPAPTPAPAPPSDTPSPAPAPARRGLVDRLLRRNPR